MSWPTDLFWRCLRQSTLKARFCVAVQNSNNSTSCPFQRAPVHRLLHELQLHGCLLESDSAMNPGVFSGTQASGNLRRCWWQQGCEHPHVMRNVGEAVKKRRCREEANCSVTLVANGQVLCRGLFWGKLWWCGEISSLSLIFYVPQLEPVHLLQTASESNQRHRRQWLQCRDWGGHNSAGW